MDATRQERERARTLVFTLTWRNAPHTMLMSSSTYHNEESRGRDVRGGRGRKKAVEGGGRRAHLVLDGRLALVEGHVAHVDGRQPLQVPQGPRIRTVKQKRPQSSSRKKDVPGRSGSRALASPAESAGG